MQARDDTVAAPNAANDEAFRQLVAGDVRGLVGPEGSAALRRPEVLDAWREALTELLQSVERQLAARRENVIAMSPGSQRGVAMREYSKWRRDALWFMGSVRTRLSEAKRLQRRRDEKRSTAAKSDFGSRIETLEWNVARLECAVKAISNEVAS